MCCCCRFFTRQVDALLEEEERNERTQAPYNGKLPSLIHNPHKVSGSGADGTSPYDEHMRLRRELRRLRTVRVPDARAPSKAVLAADTTLRVCAL